MAYTQSLSPSAPFRDVHALQTQQLPPSVVGHSGTHASPMQQLPRQSSKQRFVVDLSQCLFDFVIQLLPTQEEMAVKEDVRKLLERLIRTIEPDSRLLSFGSTANGFSLRNSDMDLCCLIDSDEKLSATDLVTMLGDLLERETKFHVKPLPHARIPIVKLSLDPSPGLPLGIACDIGFENRLALENTRLLMCYAMIDPTRVRTLVLFLKVWSKRRKINSPYKGTLSSYGYVLLVIYFLVHVKNPPVLPNLQQMPPLRPITKEDTHLNGYNTWFFDDIDLLRQRWHSENTETVAELLIDFFRYYARDFAYNTGVASIRAGLLKKDSKGWQNELTGGRFNDPRERNRLCIEDPFELDYNVARCVTKDGLYTIRGEFMRAARVLASRPERAIVALAELCEERKDEELVTAPPYTSPRPPTLPPQTPYTVGSQSLRPKGGSISERFSPPAQFFEPGPRLAAQQPQQAVPRPPPEHMGPRRAKWTSPPPPEATPADVALFESQLGRGLVLATSSTAARESEASYNSESSEVFTDEDRSDAAESDDIASVRSYTEGSAIPAPGTFRRPSWHMPNIQRLPQVHLTTSSDASPSRSPSSPRGRFPRSNEKINSSPPTSFLASPEVGSSSPHSELSRRSLSGPPRSFKNGSPVWTSHTPLAISTPLPPSPESPLESRSNDPSTVFYQTTTRSPRPTIVYPTAGSHNSFLSQYQSQPHSPHSPFQRVHHQPQFMGQVQVPQDIFLPNLPPSLSSLNPRNTTGRSSAGPETPTPATYSHGHSHSTTTVTAPTPPPHTNKFPAQPTLTRSPLVPSPSHQSPSLPQAQPQSPQLPLASQPPNTPGQVREHFLFVHDNNGSTSPQPSAVNSNGSSPTPSSTGYSTSISRSPSPHSPSPPPTAMPIKQKDDNVLGFDSSFSGFTVRDTEDLPSSPTFLIDVEQHRDKPRS